MIFSFFLSSPGGLNSSESLEGLWRFEGPRATLLLHLAPGRRFQMQRPGRETLGRWRQGDGALWLRPDGGAELRYRFRRQGDQLWLGGGDLPDWRLFRRVAMASLDLL